MRHLAHRDSFHATGVRRPDSAATVPAQATGRGPADDMASPRRRALAPSRAHCGGMSAAIHRFAAGHPRSPWSGDTHSPKELPTMIKNTRNVRDLALAALDQVSGAGLAGPRFDMLPPDIAVTPFPKLDLDVGCPACGVLGSDIGFDLGAELSKLR
jgi:hypothetical protein